jgi:hypothetical protein
MPISTISQKWEAYCRYKLKNRFPAANAGKLSAMNMKKDFLLSDLCSGSPMDIHKPHILA